MNEMSITALALFLSMHDTGALVVPYEAQQARAAAITQYGFDGLRAEAFKRACFSCAAEPDAYADRIRWARAAAGFVETP
ncbi:hypothetical protein AB0N09_28085 [Streptomyces erythrochromogenes]|uniref:hypothetical protein n=1 Tax=Streptomyces erythrochromogenes TaxID=285574 RepID=UPI003446227B